MDTIQESESDRKGLVTKDDQIDPRITEQFSRVNFVRRWITVEPTIFLYFMALIPLIPLGEQYIIAQVAERRNAVPVSKNSTVSSCHLNVTNNVSALEKEIQAEASQWLILFNACSFLPGIIVTVLIGSYSDHMGRKIGVAAPLIGNFLRCCFSALVIALDFPFELLTIGILIDGFSGGVASVIAAVFSSLSDITTHKQRAFRIMVVEIALGFGIVTGQFGAGILIQKIGFAATFGVCALIQAINGLYVSFVLMETRIDKQKKKFFTTEHFVRIWKLFSSYGEGQSRWKIVLSLIILCLSQCIESGSIDNLTYFQIARPLCFTSVLIGYWQALNYGVKITVALVTVKILTGRLSDPAFICIGLVSGIAFYILVAFSSTTVMIFSVVAAGAWYSLVTPMVRSISSKSTSPNEQGVVFSAVAMVQTLSMFMGTAMFDAIYAATLSLYRGVTFLIQAGVLFCALCLAIYLWIRTRREKKIQTLVVVEEDS